MQKMNHQCVHSNGGKLFICDVKRKCIVLKLLDNKRKDMLEVDVADFDNMFPGGLPPILWIENSVYNSATTFDDYHKIMNEKISQRLLMVGSLKDEGSKQDSETGTETSGETAGETAGETSSETAGETSGETSGETASKTAVEIAGETLGKTASEMASETTGELAGEIAGETSCDTEHDRDTEHDNEIQRLEKLLKDKFLTMTTEEVITKNFQSDEFHLHLRRFEILTRYSIEGNDENTKIDLTDETISWILSTADVMEKLMYSGNTVSIAKSIIILKTILELDDGAKTGWKLKLAVAIALTFNEEIRQRQPTITSICHYFEDGPIIDGIKRYCNFVKWAQAGELFNTFFDLSVWHLRNVVNAYVSDDELICARKIAKTENLPSNPEKIRNSFFGDIIKYKAYRLGTEFTNPENFYLTNWVTLKDIYHFGGACGAKAHFGAALSQAHGLPAQILLQPGHAMYIWYKPETGWVLSGQHRFSWQYAWFNECGQRAYVDSSILIPYMEQLQKFYADNTDPISKALTVAAIMQFEWGFNTGLSFLEKFYSTKLGERLLNSFNIPIMTHHIPSRFQNLNVDDIIRVAAKELSSENLLKYTIRSELETLQFKDFQWEISGAVLNFKSFSMVRKIELTWKSKKYEPKKVEILYKFEGELILKTEDFTAFPDALVDQITLLFDYGDAEFYPFKVRKMVFKGVMFPLDKILDTCVNQHFHDNELAKICVKRIVSWILYRFSVD